MPGATARGNKPNQFILDGQRFTPEEFALAKARPGDERPFDRKLTTNNSMFADGYANRFSGDKDLPTGFQRVADARSGKATVGGEPKLTKKAVRRTKPTVAPGRKINRPAVSRGAKAKSILKNTSNKDTLG